MRRYLMIMVLAFCVTTCGQAQETDNSEIKEAVNTSLENWHAAAAAADFEKYFGLMTADGVFLGTDASENWQNDEFRDFSKPYFDKGKAWAFSTLERNIYVDSDGETAWFDELLSTQMGICRGSGVMKIEDGTWKVKHYVLSIAVPNENVTELTALKKKKDSLIMKKLKGKN